MRINLNIRVKNYGSACHVKIHIYIYFRLFTYQKSENFRYIILILKIIESVL